MRSAASAIRRYVLTGSAARRTQTRNTNTAIDTSTAVITSGSSELKSRSENRGRGPRIAAAISRTAVTAATDVTTVAGPIHYRRLTMIRWVLTASDFTQPAGISARTYRLGPTAVGAKFGRAAFRSLAPAAMLAIRYSFRSMS